VGNQYLKKSFEDFLCALYGLLKLRCSEHNGVDSVGSMV